MAAIERDDFEHVARLAHNLQGSGSAFGFPLITELGGRLQYAASVRDMAQSQREAAALQCDLESYGNPGT